MKEKRRDSKGRILHTGESQRTDGKYLYKTIYTSSRTGETVVPWSAAYIYEEVIRPEGYRLRQHMHLHKRPPRKKVAPIPSVIED